MVFALVSSLMVVYEYIVTCSYMTCIHVGHVHVALSAQIPVCRQDIDIQITCCVLFRF